MAPRLLLLLAFFMKAALAGNNITILPGFTGELPFPLESGYVGVGNNEEVQLFYLFAESQNSPTTDPVLLWLLGGPGCSSLTSFFFEHGPLTFDYSSYNWDGSLPTLILNEYAWTQNISIIYLDAPAGTGYSYSTTAEGWPSGDYVFAEQLDEFLRKWFAEHPTLLNNSLYLGGNGYAGNQIPIAIQDILDGNEAGGEPSLNIKGYVMGNPGADKYIDFNARYTFANRLALVSDELYQEADLLCSGNFTEPPNESCNDTVNEMNALTSNINAIQILEPACKDVPNYLQLKSVDQNAARRFLKEKFQNYRSSLQSDAPTSWCRKYNHELCYIWANNETVKEALYVAEEVRSSLWESCNDSIIVGSAYDPKVSSVVGYHKNLSETNLRGLIYSGDHDLEISYIATQKWIFSLELPLVKNWSVWSVNSETAGYMRKFSSSSDFNLTFATVKGGGHYAAEYKPAECFEMANRWLVNDTVIAS